MSKKITLDVTKVSNRGTDKLLDAMGNTIEIGDIVLGAKASRYGDPEYSYMIVMGRTEKMLKVRKAQTGWDARGRNMCFPTKQSVADAIKYAVRSGPHKMNGAAVSPWVVLNTGVKIMTMDEIQNAMDEGIKERDRDAASIANLSTPWAMATAPAQKPVAIKGSF